MSPVTASHRPRRAAGGAGRGRRRAGLEHGGRVAVVTDETGLTARELREGFREFGYVEGETLLLQFRWTEGGQDAHDALAWELVAESPDATVVNGSFAALAAQRATATIPIVVAVVNDAVAERLAPAGRMLRRCSRPPLNLSARASGRGHATN